MHNGPGTEPAVDLGPIERDDTLCTRSVRERHDARNVVAVMAALRTIALAAALLSLAGCQSEPSTPPEQADPISSIRIELDVNAPAKSTGILSGAELNHAFHVGYGKYGIACEGSRFEEGVTPLGTFRVNAVLSDDIFEMDPELIEQSGRTRDDLKSTLFRSMSAIDFKGDGETGEYGSGYISLAPVPATPQPFEFNEYAGQFRWYSFAIHGTNDERRVGNKVTGGCLNVTDKDLKVLLKHLSIGDEVEITANGPCIS